MKKKPIDPYILSGILKNKSARFAFSEGKKISSSLVGAKTKFTLKGITDFHVFSLKNLDEYFEKFHKQVNIKPSCEKGCEACCRYPIFTSKLEYEVIKEWSNGHLDTVIKKNINNSIEMWDFAFKEYKSKWEGRQSGELNNNIEYKTYLNDEEYSIYTEKDIKCPFLQNSICTIYDVRPVACRIYYSYGDNKECSTKLYPEGTISYDCGRYNIYKVPLLNYFYPNDIVLDYTNTLDLLPLWFLKVNQNYNNL